MCTSLLQVGKRVFLGAHAGRLLSQMGRHTGGGSLHARYHPTSIGEASPPMCYVTVGTFARRGLSSTAKTLRSLSGVRGSEY